MMSPAHKTDVLTDLIQRINIFVEERNWQQFHNPKNLSMALAVEASELMEIFQWVESKDLQELTEKQLEASKHEVADIFIYLLRFCSITGINLLQATEEKLRINAEKYPVEKARGRADKYSDL